MKKIISTGVVAGVMLLAGCGVTTTGSITTVYTDSDTQCEYITTDTGGMTPRYELVDGEEKIKGCE